MTKTLAAGLAVLAVIGQARAAEPLAGTWLLTAQEVAGRKAEPAPLTLRIVRSGNEQTGNEQAGNEQAGGALDFAYSVPVNNIQFVSLKFAARLDGSEADVQDADDHKIGTVQLTRGSATQYRVTLKGPNRPTSHGSMTLSADMKTLVCESDSAGPDGSSIHTVQVFSRQH